MSKRFQMLVFRGSRLRQGFGVAGDHGKAGDQKSDISVFGHGKAANDKKVPDPVGSEVFVLRLVGNSFGGVWLGRRRSAQPKVGLEREILRRLLEKSRHPGRISDPA